jgi:hypothetical protein
MTVEAASRLVEFARACKAAARVVSMYPPSHPAIQSALDRMVAAGSEATSRGAFTMTVLPDTMMVDGRGLPKADGAVTDLALLLHRHQIGELTLLAPLTAGAWHMLLSLLAMPPEDVRREGGVTRAWQLAGGGPVEIREIDYAEVLKERIEGTGVDATWDELIASCLTGDMRGALDEKTLASLLEIARDPQRLGEFMNRLQERARAMGVPSELQKQSLRKLLQGLANYAAHVNPDEFDALMNNVAEGTTRLTAELLLSLLGGPAPSPADVAGTDPQTAEAADDLGVDLGGELRSRFTEEMLGAFVAENVVRDRGATTRLAEAFNALATDDPRRRTALALAEERVSMSPLGSDPQFNDIWANAMSLLMSYTDADYVPDEYDRELTSAREMAVEVEQVSDDPPDRIAAWLSTVGDDDLRALDQQMLVDLLHLEDRPDAWTSVLELAVTRLEQLVLVGDLRLAGDLAGAIAGTARDPHSPFAGQAAGAIDRLAGGPLIKNLMLFMRQAEDTEIPLLDRLCQAMGPVLVAPLAAALAAEESRLAVRRVKDVLIGFGDAARAPAKALRNSTNPAVRRAAIELLRAVGGEDALPDLRTLLEDADPHVQREALRAIIHIGSDDAFAMLEEVLKGGDPRTREAIMHTLGSLHDERAAPLLVHILRQFDHRGAAEAAYCSAIEALGRSGAHPEGIEALRDVLHRGEWWAPGRTARIRAVAAMALHATASAAGDAALQDASINGSRGVRAAATRAMSTPRRTSPAGGTE